MFITIVQYADDYIHCLGKCINIQMIRWFIYKSISANCYGIELSLRCIAALDLLKFIET